MAVLLLLLKMTGRGGAGDRRSPQPHGAEAKSPSSSSAAGGAVADWPALLDTGADHQDGDDESTDYRRRCMLLEASLVKFKEKATRVRQLFTVKVCF